MLGFQRARFDVAGAIDICPANVRVLRRKYPNAKIIAGDVRDNAIRHTLPPDIDVVTAALPCQPSSTLHIKRNEAKCRVTLDVGHSMVSMAVYMQPSVIRPGAFAGHLIDNCLITD